MTNSEQCFTWHEFGLNIHIPKKSLPEGVQLVRIHIRSAIKGDFQLPHDTHLVSAVYSIRCLPECQFAKPLTLEIQHCAKPENYHKLCFIRSTSGSNVHHDVIEPGDNELTKNVFCYCFFPWHTSFGFVELTKYCTVCIGQRGTDKRLYHASVYRDEVDVKRHKLYFSIVWDTNYHNQVKHAVADIFSSVLH